MENEPTLEPDRQPAPAPLTERVLERLGRPRWLWIALWSAVPLASGAIFATAIDLTGPALDEHALAETVTTQSVLVYTCLVVLVGGGQLGRQVRQSQASVASLITDGASRDTFRGIGGRAGPLLLTALVAGLVSLNGWLRYGPGPPLAALITLCVCLVPIMTFVWVYLVILVDLYRLGRQPLRLAAFPEDRTLGLERLGSLASTGFGLLLVAAVPVLLAGAEDPVTLGVSLAVVVLAVVTFVVSMWGLHRQMSAAKAGYLAEARRLYAEAYAPVRAAGTLAMLDAQSSALSGAKALVERAESLQTWPLDEGTLRFTIVVVAGIVAGVIVRGLFAAIGF